MKRIHFALICGLTLTCGMARADLIAITLDMSALTGAPGDILQFSGTLDNTTGTDLFLNADNFNLGGFDPSAIDDSPFFANTPADLGPGGSTGDVGLFNIDIPDSFPIGTYDGTFQILGGATSDDQTVIGSVDFAVEVTPEPSSGALLLAIPIALEMSRRFRGLQNRHRLDA
jgi:hypothetical protein